MNNELMKVKADAYDAMILLNEYKSINSKLQHILFVIANKLGVDDMSQLDVTSIPDLLDQKLNELKKE